MTHKFDIRASFVILCVLLSTASCETFPDTKGKPYTPTNLDTLQFLVSNSDLIAIVNHSGGTDKPKPFLFTMPKKVDAKILSIIKGGEDREEIEISCNPKNLNPNVIKSTMILRNGKHLVFLCKTGENYQPTTSNSLLSVFNHKVYPVWRPDQYKESEDAPDGLKVSSGIELGEILEEIRTEIEQS